MAADFPVQSVAEVATPFASGYLQQLCKHFQHRLPVEFDAHAGVIGFEGGECRLEGAAGALKLAVAAADVASRERLEEVVARHLVRFAFREEIPINWRPA
jgi:uncharacterized protein